MVGIPSFQVIGFISTYAVLRAILSVEPTLVVIQMSTKGSSLSVGEIHTEFLMWGVVV